MGVMLAGVFNSGILATGAIPGATSRWSDRWHDVGKKLRHRNRRD